MKDYRKQMTTLRYGAALILIAAAISVFYCRHKVAIESVVNRDRHDQLVRSQQAFINNGYAKRPIAEYEPVDRLLLAWPPRRLENKEGTEKKVLRLYYRNFEKFLLNFISEVQRSQPPNFLIEIAVSEDAERQLLQKRISDPAFDLNPDAVTFILIPVDTNWIRDFSPIFIQNRPLAKGRQNTINPDLVSASTIQACSFQYGLNRADDIDFAANYCDMMGIPAISMPIIMEKGNFMTDGRGNCFLGDNILTQNSDFNREKIEVELREKLGCQNIIFLKSNPFDATGGHIDFMAKIVKPDTVIVNRLISNTPQEIAELFDQNADLLVKKGFRVIRVPSGVFKIKHRLFFPNYANSLIINGVVYMPVYSSGSNYMGMTKEHDRIARRIYESMGYTVVPIDSTVFIYFRGSIHCTTSEIPKNVVHSPS